MAAADSKAIRALLARSLNGWDISGIYTYQTGFPVRITSSSDNELMYSAFFEYPGEPDQVGAFTTKVGTTTTDGGIYYFDPIGPLRRTCTFGSYRQCHAYLLLRSADQQF